MKKSPSSAVGADHHLGAKVCASGGRLNGSVSVNLEFCARSPVKCAERHAQGRFCAQ